jgi:hypothetical protein
MAFATRCPDCRAKLRLPSQPDPDENVECPKCGSVFLVDDDGGSDGDDAPAPKRDKPKKEKKPKKDKAPKGPVGPKKRKVKKKKSNPVLLFTMLGLALAFVIGLGIFLWIYLGRAGKMDEMMSYLPGDCNVVRGFNVGQISKYPGFAAEPDQFVNSTVKAASDDLAKAMGLDDGEALRDYVVIAKAKKDKQQAGVVYIFRAKKAFKPNPLDGAAGMKAADANGTPYYRSTGKGILDNAAVFTPTDKLVIVVAKGAQQTTLLNAVAGGGMKNKENMFLGKVGDTGRRTAAGNMWCVVVCEGPMKNYAKEMGDSVKSAFPGLNKACGTAKCIGWWTSYGGRGISFGGAIDCGDSAGAYECMKSMRDSELGKGDDAELPNDFKRAVQGAASKEFGEFLQYLKFTYTGSCAYFVSKMSAEKGKSYTGRLHGLSIAGFDNETGAAEGVPGLPSGAGAGAGGGANAGGRPGARP